MEGSVAPTPSSSAAAPSSAARRVLASSSALSQLLGELFVRAQQRVRDAEGLRLQLWHEQQWRDEGTASVVLHEHALQLLVALDVSYSAPLAVRLRVVCGAEEVLLPCDAWPRDASSHATLSLASCSGHAKLLVEHARLRSASLALHALDLAAALAPRPDVRGHLFSHGLGTGARELADLLCGWTGLVALRCDTERSAVLQTRLTAMRVVDTLGSDYVRFAAHSSSFPLFCSTRPLDRSRLVGDCALFDPHGRVFSFRSSFLWLQRHHQISSLFECVMLGGHPSALLLRVLLQDPSSASPSGCEVRALWIDVHIPELQKWYSDPGVKLDRLSISCWLAGDAAEK